MRIIGVEVPSEAAVGRDVLLQCHYDLEGSHLYALKWYKGSHGAFFLSIYFRRRLLPFVRVFVFVIHLLSAPFHPKILASYQLAPAHAENNNEYVSVRVFMCAFRAIFSSAASEAPVFLSFQDRFRTFEQKRRGSQ